MSDKGAIKYLRCVWDFIFYTHQLLESERVRKIRRMIVQCSFVARIGMNARLGLHLSEILEATGARRLGAFQKKCYDTSKSMS